ncbi:putative membrane protein [Variovorax boronicumulans]|uniref:TadG family pilus assembly protein n=1 Tax=Variovorax boronicumulans TaxID=436515 RepID=UPI00277F02D2|nr:TadG family pilus assembly protein [Variovorax boronicumulans]MDQ0072198.1 putative membrane protein [Variovorax boronicumulans]
MLVNAVIALSLIVIVLIGSELGYLFYLKREFQKSADLSALAGAQALVPDNCTSATAAAIANASQNLPSGFQMTAADVVCGRWDPENQPSPRHFSPGMQPFNAVSVTIQRTPPLLLPSLPGNQPRVLSLEALAAKTDPSAAFSVGSRLLRFSGDSTLGALLKAIGLDLDNTIVAGYEGLATVSITPGDLLCTPPLKSLVCPAADITVGGLNDLLNANVTLGQLLDAVVTAGGRQDLLNANVALISAIKAKLGADQLNVKLGSLTGIPSLFANITTPGATSALEAQINALDLIQAAIGVATGGHAIDIPGLNISLLGLVTVTTKAGLVEPPSIAIGVKGITAYTAQVRTFIHVKTNGLLGSLLKINLPIALDLVAAKGTLLDLCTPALVSPAGKQRAEISVEGAILKGCIGKISNSTGSQDCSLSTGDPRYQACFDQLIFSKKDACEQNLSSMELVNVLGFLKIPKSLPINALPIEQPTTVILEAGQTGTTGNSLAIGTTVSNLVSTLTNLLFGTAPLTGTPSPADISSLANQIWTDSGKSVSDGGAGCTADTMACRALRLENARTHIAQNAANSGLLSGILNGLGDLLGAVGGILGGDGCSYTGLLGSTSNAGCVNLIKNTLNKTSGSDLGGVVSNALAVVAGLLKPILNAVGSAVLTPLLQNLLGIHLGEVDVKLQSLQCNNAQLVY